MKTFSALLRAAIPILAMVIPVLGQSPIVSGIVNGAGGSTFSPGTLGLVIGRDFVPAPVNCATATAWVEWCSGLGIGFTDANGKKAQAAIGTVTPTQITFQVPVDLALGPAIAIVIRNVGSQFFGAEMRALNLEAYSPGLSIRNDAGKTIGAFLDNVSGPILTSKPVNPGDLASVLGFGLGPTNPAVPTGQMPVAPVNTTAQPVLRVGWVSAPIRYSFQVPGSVGAYQVGFRVPANTPGGDQPVELEIGGKKSNVVLLPVSGSPRPGVTAVVNAASGEPAITAGTWFSVFGANLSSKSRSWTGADIVGTKLPTELDGVSVKVNGKNAAISYISSSQINGLAPADSTAGDVSVEVTSTLGTGTGPGKLASLSPAFFLFSSVEGGKYLAAVHLDGVYLGRPDLFQGAVATRPARPNGTVILFGTGFGLTEPAVSPSETFSGAAPLVSSNPLTIKIGGKVAKVQFAGLVSPGLYQFNVEVPELEPGDHLVVAEIGGSATQALRYITVGS